MRKLIEDLNKKINLSGGVISDEDKTKFLEMNEEYEANNKAMIEMGKFLIFILY